MSLIRCALALAMVAALNPAVGGAQLPAATLPPSGPPPLAIWPDETLTPDERERIAASGRRLLEQIRADNGVLLVAQVPPPDDDGFEPLSELPPDERLPAAPMLVGAYVAVLLALFAYLFSLSRRLASVKQEIARLEADVKRTGRP